MFCCYRKYCVVFAILICQLQSGAQYGSPVFLQDFGEGILNSAFIGPALAPGRTAFLNSNELCPPPGSYTIARRINFNGCFNDEWIPLGSDHSTGTDFGMMMIVNNATQLGKLVYMDTVNRQLCPGTAYNAIFFVINVDKPEPPCRSGPDFPRFELRVESDAGLLLKKDTSFPVSYADPTFGYKFASFGIDFIMPSGINRLVIKISLIPSSAWCAEDFAIDDVMVRPFGPLVNISFDNEPPTTFVKSVCFQDNKTVSLTGTLGPYYVNPAFQWQKSGDGGLTWTDIPGETTLTYSSVLSVPDTFLVRLSAGESVNITNPGCRVVSNSYRIEVDDIPRNYIVTNNSPLCAGEDLKFTATGGATYLWGGPNGFWDNIQSPHIFQSSLADSGMYYVKITTPGGCSVTDSTHVTMIGTDVDAGPDTALCKGSSIRLWSSSGVKYEWLPANGLLATNVSNPRIKPDVTTKYTVRVTDNSGCSDTASVLVRVLNTVEVKAIIDGTDHLCRMYDSASFKDMSSGIITRRQWEFSNGQSDTTRNPPIQYYNIPGNRDNYIARLAVSDAAGCADTAYHLLEVEDNCNISVPTAFTPNGDGLNDYLYPLNAFKATNLSFRIFNRSGRLVFETKDMNRKWDGRVGGVLQATGVFIWILEFKDASNNQVSLKGTTTLIR